MVIKDCCFNLPDDFNGTFLDALKLVVQYREEAEGKKEINRHPVEENSNFSLLWNNEKIKCSISYGFTEFDENKENWINDAEWINKIMDKLQ